MIKKLLLTLLVIATLPVFLFADNIGGGNIHGDFPPLGFRTATSDITRPRTVEVTYLDDYGNGTISLPFETSGHASGTYVPYTGAISDVDLGIHTLGAGATTVTSLNSGSGIIQTTGKIIGSLYDIGTTAYTSQYPTQDTDHVKATTTLSASYNPWFTTDPTKSLTGNQVNNQWIANTSTVTNQRFHIDLGTAQVVKRIYYENSHTSGASTNYGAKTFTLWGSNTAGDFTDLVYADDGTWVPLTCDQTYFDEHIPFNIVDPKYIAVTNTTAYRYYAIKIADNWGSTAYLGIRRIELQTSGAGTPTLSLDSDARKLYGIDGTTLMFDYSEMGYVKFGNNVVQSPYIIGGEAANDDIIIQGTTNPTRTTSYVNLQPNGGYTAIGVVAANSIPLHVGQNVQDNAGWTTATSPYLYVGGTFGIAIGEAGTGVSWIQNGTLTRATRYGISLQPNGSGVSIGTITAPTALLMLGAGTATAGTAPLKFTAGVVNTVAEAGTIEYVTGAFVLQSDKLGIGVANPAYPLQVNTTGVDSTVSDVLRLVSKKHLPGVGTAISFGTTYSDPTSYPDWSLARISGFYVYPNDAGSTYGGALSFSVNAGAAGDSTMTERMRITTAGYVGIGVTSPITTLDVWGTPSIAGDSRSIVRLIDTTSYALGVGGGFRFGGKYDVAGNVTGFAYIQGIKENGTTADWAGALVMGTIANGGSFTEKWRIGSNGDLTNTGAVATAYLHLKAGTATAGTAPLKFTAGTLTTLAEAGVIEYTSNGFSMRSDKFGIGNAPSYSLDVTSANQTDLSSAYYTNYLHQVFNAAPGADTKSRYTVYATATGTYASGGSTAALGFLNSTVGTGTGGFTANTANYGVFGITNGTTAGDNIGTQGYAANGTRSAGIVGVAPVAKNSGTNIGVYGGALNTGTSAINAGGFFFLGATTPTFVSGALVASNGTTTDPILVLRDNTTTVFSVIDGGNVGIGVTPWEVLTVSGDQVISDTSPHLTFRDSSDNTAYQFHLDTSDAYNGYFQLWRGTDTGTGFNVNPNDPLLKWDSSNNLYVGNNGGSTEFESDGTIDFNGTSGITIPHMMQSDSTDQSIVNPVNAQIITFDTDVHHNQITRTSSSRFTVTKTGSYLITFSGVTMGTINDYIDVWMRTNGVDVANSNTIYQYKSNNATTVVAVAFLYHFNAGDYFEFWTWGTSTNDKWDATPAVAAVPGVSPARPACPSIIITTNYVGKD